MATPASLIKDETAGLTLVSPGGETREQTRYLFFPGDIIDPIRKRQDPKMAMGGEEVVSHCLRRTPFRNFLPRCAFVPLEKWFEPIGIPELAGDRMGDLVTVAQTGPPRPQVNLEAPQLFRAPEPTKGVPRYPGEEVPLIMETAGARGVREIRGMRGIDWDSGEAQEIHEFFFPREFKMPTQLRLIEEQIKRAADTSVEPIIASITEDLLQACQVFRNWGQFYINLQHGLLRTRTKHDWTYAYSAISQQLLDQLEISAFEEGSAAIQMLEKVLERLQPSQQVNVADVVTQVMLALEAQKAAEESRGDKKK